MNGVKRRLRESKQIFYINKSIIYLAVSNDTDLVDENEELKQKLKEKDRAHAKGLIFLNFCKNVFLAIADRVSAETQVKSLKEQAVSMANENKKGSFGENYKYLFLEKSERILCEAEVNRLTVAMAAMAEAHQKGFVLIKKMFLHF